MSSQVFFPLAAVAALGGLLAAACNDVPPATAARVPTADVGTADGAGVHRRYGVPVALGEGRARTYVVLDQQAGGVPVEVGVALDERALDGLPAGMPTPPGCEGEHGHSHRHELALPAQHGTPYRFVELNWNPDGHGCPWELPHLDFHFYTVTPAERDAIDPAQLGPAEYAARSARFPAGTDVPQFYVPLVLPGRPPLAVPRMGLHWGDVRSPELQILLGNPQGYRPFTTTFFRGSWNGAFVFDEPMITRAFILGRKSATTEAARDTVMPLPAAQRYLPAGRYPGAYRVTWDERAREYRVGLTQLAERS